jgi:hypothetical protein
LSSAVRELFLGLPNEGETERKLKDYLGRGASAASEKICLIPSFRSYLPSILPFPPTSPG